VTITGVAAAVLVAFATAIPAAADPTPAPAPPYQILTPEGPAYGGLRTLPPVVRGAAARVQPQLESEHRSLGRAAGKRFAVAHV
jgi:hypothetical protein